MYFRDVILEEALPLNELSIGDIKGKAVQILKRIKEIFMTAIGKLVKLINIIRGKLKDLSKNRDLKIKVSKFREKYPNALPDSFKVLGSGYHLPDADVQTIKNSIGKYVKNNFSVDEILSDVHIDDIAEYDESIRKYIEIEDTHKYDSDSVSQFLTKLNKMLTLPSMYSRNLKDELKEIDKRITEVSTDNKLNDENYNKVVIAAYSAIQKIYIVHHKNLTEICKSIDNVVSSINSAGKEESNSEEDLEIGNGFIEAVNNNKLIRVRIMIKDSLLVDRSFKQANKMIEAAEKKMPDLWDEHDGQELDYDKSHWNDELMNREMVRVVNNFSHERIDFLKAIVKYLYG